jgi:hypothetical protein
MFVPGNRVNKLGLLETIVGTVLDSSEPGPQAGSLLVQWNVGKARCWERACDLVGAYSESSTFSIGQRVELHPGCDLWMRGARYGAVVGVSGRRIRVKLDRYPRVRAFSPALLRIAE